MVRIEYEISIILEEETDNEILPILEARGKELKEGKFWSRPELTSLPSCLCDFPQII